MKSKFYKRIYRIIAYYTAYIIITHSCMYKSRTHTLSYMNTHTTAHVKHTAFKKIIYISKHNLI